MEINGVPLHPLVVHAVVVFAPLAALFGIAYAVLPGWRWALRWPLVAVTGIAVVTAFIATLSGQDLADSSGLIALPEVADPPGARAAAAQHPDRRSPWSSGWPRGGWADRAA